MTQALLTLRQDVHNLKSKRFDFIDFILVDQVCIEYLSSVGILQETYCYEGNHEYQCSFSMGTTAKS